MQKQFYSFDPPNETRGRYTDSLASSSIVSDGGITFEIIFVPERLSRDHCILGQALHYPPPFLMRLIT